MFTQLMRFHVGDPSGQTAPLDDLCIALLDDDYPPVTHLLFRHDNELRQISCDDIGRFDWKRRRINIESLDAASADEKCDVLLSRDIMDSLVLDLLGRRTTRVCDLQLREKEGALRLIGVDAGLLAMIRRVTRGAIGSVDHESLFDWKYVEFLRGDPEAVDNGAGYRLRINRLPAGEIARLSDYIPYLHAAELLKLLPDEKAADVLQTMVIDRQVQVIEELPDDEAVDLIGRMSPDLATDLVGRLHPDTMRSYISRLPAERREKIVELLRYPENSVGGVMTNDIIKFPSNITAGEAQAQMQGHIKGADLLSVVFLTDTAEDGKLLGTLSLRELLAADAKTTLDSFMDPYVAALEPYGSAQEAAFRIVGAQLVAMPVVNSVGRLIGAMTMSAAISKLVPPASGLRGVRIFS